MNFIVSWFDSSKPRIRAKPMINNIDSLAFQKHDEEQKRSSNYVSSESIVSK